MTFRRLATGAALAIAGLAAAVGIGLLANSISGDSVGLGAEPLSAGTALAPASVQKAEERSQKRHRRRHRNRGGDDTRTTTSGTLTNQIAPAEPGDDNGSARVGTDDNSGSGSSGSGSTPGGSGSSDDSSGSGSSGSSGGPGSSSHSGGSDDD
jgi:hypothetical protein